MRYILIALMMLFCSIAYADGLHFDDNGDVATMQECQEQNDAIRHVQPPDGNTDEGSANTDMEDAVIRIPRKDGSSNRIRI